MPMSSTQRVAQTVLNKETDARFWAQTGYRPGQKLDPSNPTDKAMTRVWLDIYAKVKAEDAAGKLALTYNHPQVEQHLNDAAVANQAAATHLDAAATAPDPATAASHEQAAQAASTIGQQSAAQAAAYQPPTASPAVAQAASAEAHAAAGQVPPRGVVVFPVGHPAHGHPHAQPAHPDLAATAPRPGRWQPPRGAMDHLALAQAGSAPKRSGDAYAAWPRPHWAYSDYQHAADDLFASSGNAAAVVAFDQDGVAPAVVPFPDSASASSAYDQATNAPMDRWYIALYDRAKSAEPNGRVDETYLGGLAVEHTTTVEHTTERVTEAPVLPPIVLPSPAAIAPSAKPSRTAEYVAIGAAVAATLGLVFMAMRGSTTVRARSRGRR